MEAAFALIDVMKSSNIPIKTVGLGCIASSGLLMFLAGHVGRRVLTPNTSILSHQYSNYHEGKHHELFAMQKEHSLIQHRMLMHYKSCTGLDDATILATKSLSVVSSGFVRKQLNLSERLAFIMEAQRYLDNAQTKIASALYLVNTKRKQLQRLDEANKLYKIIF
jgi:hypothetical protein